MQNKNLGQQVKQALLTPPDYEKECRLLRESIDKLKWVNAGLRGRITVLENENKKLRK